MRPARTKTYGHTINGLLKRRAIAFNEREALQARLVAVTGDIIAIDRILLTLGRGGDLDAEMPRAQTNAMFKRGELMRAVLGELRIAQGPLTSRDIARAILAKRGENEPSRKLLYECTRRVSKAVVQAAKRAGLLGAWKAEGRCTSKAALKLDEESRRPPPNDITSDFRDVTGGPHLKGDASRSAL